jgi:hypothetical protein
MCYGENGTVNFFQTLADIVFRNNFFMMQIFFKFEKLENFRVTQVYTIKANTLSGIERLFFV